MPEQQLGRLEEVDLRSVWGDEARDFTPWLAEHLALLGDAVGIRLGLIGQEQPVGSFSADIIADGDLGVVVIENQLEKTDHTHLGQLLTYAAGHEARVLIWVTPEVRDEHRAAIDWLNRFTLDEVEVYAVEVRAVKIGDSSPAPEFRAVAFPNDWSRKSHQRSSESSGAAIQSDQYREFFQPVVDALRERGLTEQTRAYRYYALRIPSEAAIDKAEYMVSLTTPTSGHLANVYLYLGSSDRSLNMHVYEALEAQRLDIEREFGNELQWQPYRGYRTSIVESRAASLSDSPERRKEVQTWMVERLATLKDILEPRLLRIAENLQAEQSDAVSH